MELSFTPLAVVAGVALAAPLALGLTRPRRLRALRPRGRVHGARIAALDATLGDARGAAGHDRRDPRARRLLPARGFAALASRLGLEAHLGAFLAGATLKLVDRDDATTYLLSTDKLEAAGFGVFVPFFFVATGMRLDVDALFASSSALTRVPIFLAALLAARALPALFYRPFAAGGRRLAAAGLLQATSLSLLVVAGRIGVDMGLIRPTNYTALVAAGLLSVIVFPLVALTLLRGPY